MWDTLGADGILLYTSNFILFFLVGLTIMFFGICFRNIKLNRKAKFIIGLASSAPTLLFSFYIFGEKFSKWDTTGHILSNVLMIVLYVLAFLIAAFALAYTFLVFFKGDFGMAIPNVVIILFAAMCFAFGIKVSYGDYISSSQQKEIICFLTMVVYGGALLIWRPYITISVNVILFVSFYQLIMHAQQPDGRKPFNDGDLVNYITFLVAITAVSISVYHLRLKEAEKAESLAYLAHNDELTGLCNGPYFVKQTAEMIEENPSLAETHVIIFTNLAGLKAYNERRGFENGSRLLIDLGSKIKDAFPDGLCARQTDDHFLIFCKKEGYKKGLVDIVKWLNDYRAALVLHFSCGVYQPKKGEDIQLAIDKARYACSTIRSDRSKLYAEYDEKIDSDVHKREYVVNNLKRAIDEGWIRPYYQPVVWGKDGKLCGLEALARWVDPIYGLMPPYLFIPVLESTKLIHRVDRCILECVCRDIRRRIDEGKPAIPCSVNFSRADFDALNVLELLNGMTAKYNIPKDLLHVEVTESALTDADTLETMAETLNKLNDAGYSIWLDDFGSGYSSLNSLKDFHFDVMKIDLKFLEGFDENEKSRPLIDSVILMAKRLGMSTVCEGVETKGQYEFLRDAGCVRMQGYLFGKPYSYDDLEGMIEKGDYVISEDLTN